MTEYGYGIDVLALDTALGNDKDGAKKLLDFIKQARDFYEVFTDWYADRFMDGEEFDEEKLLADEDAYANMTEYEDENLNRGLNVIMREVIEEKEKITLYASEADVGMYLILTPRFPWALRSVNEMRLTQDALDAIYRKYVNQLANIALDIDYREFEG